MIQQTIALEKIEQMRQLLNSAQHVVTISHLSPDGDAIGSSLAMRHFLQALGKQIISIVPNYFPAFLHWLDGADDVLVYEADNKAVQKAVAECDLLVCLDFNDRKRVDGVKPFIEQCKAPKLLIDHHLDPEQFADVVISYPEASSTCELVYRCISQLGMADKITRSCADAIYAGMMTDTGNFSYASSDPEIYEIISELLKYGIDKEAIYRHVYNNYSENRVRLMGYCLANKMKVYTKQHIAVISLTLDELKRFNHQVGDTEGFVNIPLSIEGINRSVFVREDEKKVKLSFRSQGPVPVNTIASEYFGGGGHMNAAGGESYVSLNETLAKLEKIILNLKD